MNFSLLYVYFKTNKNSFIKTGLNGSRMFELNQACGQVANFGSAIPTGT